MIVGKWQRLALGIGMFCAGMFPGHGSAEEAPPFRAWGEESLARIDADFWMADRRLYANLGRADKPPEPPPAMMWDCGVQLSALAAAARLDPDKHRERLRTYIDALDVYWTRVNGLGGYDVQPGPKANDRYYDDNAWIVLGLAEAFEIMHDPRDLERAEATYKFVLSGEDNKLDGGIYWHEPKRVTKNTCVSAPAAVAALRLYGLTKKPAYLDDALRLYRWTREKLQSPEGLYWDNIKPDGSVDRATYSYNTGLMLRAASLLHAATNDAAYLEEAKRVAHAAEARWVDPATGGMRDGGRFAHLLLEGFLALADEDHDPHWVELDRKALVFVHEQVRDTGGRYGGRWDRAPRGPLTSFPLLNQASEARAYWVAALQGETGSGLRGSKP